MDSPIDTDGDTFPVGFYMAPSTGTFDDSFTWIIAGFAYDESLLGSCPDEYVVPIAARLVRAAAVTTFANGDELYSLYDTGWLCVAVTTGLWVGDNSGVFTGGTGRFEDASGTVMSSYVGKNLDSYTDIFTGRSIGFRSIQGVPEGTVTLP